MLSDNARKLYRSSLRRRGREGGQRTFCNEINVSGSFRLGEDRGGDLPTGNLRDPTGSRCAFRNETRQKKLARTSLQEMREISFRNTPSI